MLDRDALSALDWWEAAGVDTLVDERPRDWLGTGKPLGPAESAPPTPIALPGDLAALRTWLLTDPSVPGAPASRLDVVGDAASGTMIVVDMPESADRASRTLLSGEAGLLFDRMLGAIGLDRAAIYLAALSPARPASGRLDPAHNATLTRLLRQHVALVAPRRLLLLGDAAIQALLRQPCAMARGRVHAFVHDRGTAQTVASFHPRFLVQTPARKAAAWSDLQLFMAI